MEDKIAAAIDLTQLLHRYARYNHDTNLAFANWLREKPGADLHREIIGSFPSIRKTLEHNYGAEWLWTNRLRGISPTGFPVDVAGLSDAEFFDLFVQTSAGMREEVHSCDAARLAESCRYNFLNGTAAQSVRAEMVHHCLQHNTFHRGQIVMMARQLGWTDVPQSDYIVWARGVPFL